MKWRLVMLALLLVILMVIFTASLIKNSRLTDDESHLWLGLEGLPAGSLPVEEVPFKIAPVVLETDRSELNARLEAVGFQSVDKVHKLSVRQSDASTTNQN